MANEDSFITEVSDEVRRERLFGYLRRYGWIAILAVIVLVGGAAFNEWRKAQARAQAEALGDGILQALEGDDAAARVEALGALEADGTGAAILSMIRSAQQAEAGDRAAAIAQVQAIAGNGTIDALYRDLAVLKLVQLQGEDVSPADRRARLEPLTARGAPYRPLALELIALSHVDDGDTEAALAVLNDILADGETPQGLRRRASQLIVALGGTLSAT
ncbi:MAG: tetratricopeptide repeat protein [Pseudomonadota bacterium]